MQHSLFCSAAVMKPIALLHLYLIENTNVPHSLICTVVNCSSIMGEANGYTAVILQQTTSTYALEFKSLISTAVQFIIEQQGISVQHKTTLYSIDCNNTAVIFRRGCLPCSHYSFFIQ